MNARAKARLACVLDDDPGVQSFVTRVLTDSNYEALAFAEPLPLLAKVKTNPPELIVLDLTLGRSDAVEVIRQLRVLKFAGTILLISGHDDATLKAIEDIGKRHGIAMLPSLHKPFRASDLRSRLDLTPEPAAKTLELENSHEVALNLSDALRENQLLLWYQPKVDLKSLAVCGAEALLRAQHAKHGVILPAGLLPSAGDPQYQILSQFVIAQAMRDWNFFAAQGLYIPLSINFPASVVGAPDFIGRLRQQLPIDPRFPGLIAEITEDELVKDPEWFRDVATQLKLYKVSISIDSFGTANSSLSSLFDIPCVELKLARDYVANCAADPLKAAMCQAVIDLGHRFGIAVCAVGVETPDDLRTLVKMNCDRAQGRMFAKPMPPDALVQHLSRAVAPEMPAPTAEAAAR